MINLNILKFTKSYCLMLIVMGVVSVGSFFACKKNNSTNNGNSNYNPDVYAVGSITNSAKVNVATLWKNGVAQSLSDGTTDTYASSVFVSRSDVYVTGYQYSNTEQIAINGYNTSVKKYLPILWKNGIDQKITNNAINIVDIVLVFVSDNDVYVAWTDSKYDGSKPIINIVLWKNGVEQTLSNPNNFDIGGLTSLYVANGKVYIAGFASPSNDNWFATATLWTNGVPQLLGDGKTESVLGSVFVSGSDVYVVGSITDANDHPIPILWKNGAKQTLLLPTGFTDIGAGGAMQVFVQNGTVYVAGLVFNSADDNGFRSVCLWKNGISTIIANSAVNLSLYVFNNDVYIGGYLDLPKETIENITYNGRSKPVIWKNATAQVLENNIFYGGGGVSSIFVK